MNKNISIKWNIFAFMMAFSAIIIVLMWLFESVFLGSIYKTTKINSVKNASTKLAFHLTKDDEAETVDSIAENNDLCITVCYLNDDGELVTSYVNHNLHNCVLHSLETNSLELLYQSAQANGGSCLDRFTTEGSGRVVNMEGNLFDDDIFKPDDRDNLDAPESILYTSIVQKNDTTYIIFLNSVITPLASTVQTINIILVVLSVFTALLALILSFVISNIVTKPISKLTSQATKLAQGKFDADFKENSYKEISELSDSLDFAQKELSKTDKLRRELVANLSHDIRTPLTLITGYSEMMKDLPGEDNSENLQIVIDESKRLADLVGDMLDNSQIESGVGSNKPEIFDIDKACRETLDRFSQFIAKDGYNVIYEGMEALLVNADPHRITQALYNLICNAFNHCGDDKVIIVKLSTLDNPDGSQKVRICVTDHGGGISPEHLSSIWDRYYKVDKVHKRDKIGTGLGLSIVRKVMELNHGACGVESTPGKGSTFWIELGRVFMID